jgi:hypothetical protein
MPVVAVVWNDSLIEKLAQPEVQPAAACRKLADAGQPARKQRRPASLSACSEHYGA